MRNKHWIDLKNGKLLKTNVDTALREFCKMKYTLVKIVLCNLILKLCLQGTEHYIFVGLVMHQFLPKIPIVLVFLWNILLQVLFMSFRHCYAFIIFATRLNLQKKQKKNIKNGWLCKSLSIISLSLWKSPPSFPKASRKWY